MVSTFLKHSFATIERIKGHNPCQHYLHYFGTLLMFAVLFMYLLHDEVFCYPNGDCIQLSTTFSATLYGTMEASGHLPEWIFLAFQTLFIAFFIFLYWDKQKEHSKAFVVKTALTFCGLYARISIHVSVLFFSETVAKFFSQDTSSEIVTKMLSVLLPIFSFTFILSQPLFIFLWNDVFWDSDLPWAGFKSDFCSVFQQCIAFCSALFGTSGARTALVLKPYVILVFWITGFMDLYRTVSGYVLYDFLGLFLHVICQALTSGFFFGITLSHLFGESLELFNLVACAMCGISVAIAVSLQVISHRDSVLNHHAGNMKRSNSNCERYFAFLMYRIIKEKVRDLTLQKFLEEHSILCSDKLCPCAELANNLAGTANVDEISKVRLQWFKLLDKTVDLRVGESSEASDLWIVRQVLLLLGENNPYKCILEVENILNAQSYGLYTKHILYQLRKKCKETIRARLKLQDDDTQTYNRVAELFENEKEARVLKRLMDSTAESALEFWRELAQKNFRVDLFQEKGNKLLEEYDKIQKKAKKLFSSVYVNSEVTLHYSEFVRRVMNHALDQGSLLDTVRARISLYFDKGFLNVLYEKTATLVARVNKTFSCIIKSTNSKISEVLDYQPYQLIGKDINCLMTRDISRNHDSYLKKYIDSGEGGRLIRPPGLAFVVRKDGFLQPIKLQIALLPHFGQGLYFIALLQNASSDRLTMWTCPGYYMQKYCFVLTDNAGDILGVTKNCLKNFGLTHPQFVAPNEARIKSLYGINDVLPELSKESVAKKLANREEINTTMTTEIVAQNMDKESMLAENCASILEHAGKKKVLVRVEKCSFRGVEQWVYKIVNEPKALDKEIKKSENKADNNKYLGADVETNTHENKEEDKTDITSIHSMSESSGSASSTAMLTKEFKQMKASILDKSMPRILKIVNLSVVLVAFLVIAFGGVTLYFTQKLIGEAEQLCTSLLVTHRRRLEHALCRIEIRSLSNIANGIEVNVRGTRFAELQEHLATQLDKLTLMQNKVQHFNPDLLEANKYETNDVYEIERIESDYSFTSTSHSANTVIYDYVTSALLFTNFSIKELKTDFYYAQIDGTMDISHRLSYLDKTFYKLMRMGYGMTRDLLRNSTNEFVDLSLELIDEMAPTVDMLLYASLGLVAVWFAILLPMILKIHFEKRDVISVYSEMKIRTLEHMIASCMGYLKKVRSEGSHSSSRKSGKVRSLISPRESIIIKNEQDDTDLEKKELINSEETEKVGKKEEFKKFGKDFLYQILLLLLFCCGIYSYYIYKYVSTKAFIESNDTLFNQLSDFATRNQYVANLVGFMKESWIQGKVFKNLNGRNELEYYISEAERIEKAVKKPVDTYHTAFGNIAKEIVVNLETDYFCEYAISDQKGCLEIWNGALKYGYSKGMYMIIYTFQKSYYQLKQHLENRTYTSEEIKAVLRDPSIYDSEKFVLNYVYPTYEKYMTRLDEQINKYYLSKRTQDKAEYIAIAVCILVVLCTVWVKFLWLLRNQMWKSKAILIFLPSEFVSEASKATQTFILSVLKQ